MIKIKVLKSVKILFDEITKNVMRVFYFFHYMALINLENDNMIQLMN